MFPGTELWSYMKKNKQSGVTGEPGLAPNQLAQIGKHGEASVCVCVACVCVRVCACVCVCEKWYPGGIASHDASAFVHGWAVMVRRRRV